MKPLNYFFICLFVLSYNCCLAQNNSPVTMLEKYTYEELEDKFYSYKDNSQVEKSKIVAKYYLQKAKKEEKDKKYVAEGYVLNQYNRELPIALKYIDSLEAISKVLQDDRYPARIYLLKGFLYYNSDNLKLALENFLSALKYAKEKNNGRQIAIADLQIAYLNGYIGKHQETVKVLQFYYNNNEFLTEQDTEHIQLNLADAYIDVNDYDKALVLIKKGLKETLKKNSKIRYNRYLYLFGRCSWKIKRYSEAISKLEICKKYFLENNLGFDANYTMLYLGLSYTESNNKEKAIENFIKIDSIIQKTNNTFPELRDVYTYLIDYYKEKKDKEKQLYYIDRFLKIDEILDSQFKYISRELPRKYDTPKLLAEKENIISELKKKKYLSYSAICMLFLLVITLLILFYKSRKAEKKHKKIAQDLINSINKADQVVNDDQEKIIIEQEIQINKVEKSTTKIISQDIVQNILKELRKFETSESFLNEGITLSSLAKDLKTNSTYLSDIINTHKDKNFATYLNDLRINYALSRLVKDKKFRSYKTSVIADELGYNNEQAFALAFKKKTGTTLSIYIKEIDKV